MKRFVTASISALLLVFVAGVATAGPSVVKINGGGIAQNSNSGLGELLSVGGFTAIRKANGVVKGQIQSKSVLASDPAIEIASIHGSVVCIEEVAATPGVWEVRFEVTKATGLAGSLFGGYGSLFVSDGGSPGAGNDSIDEGFADPDNQACGGIDATNSSPEPVLAGNFTVH
jgi:hypothetical protein